MNPHFHHVPGRLRVRVAQLKRNEKGAGAARQLLMATAGIRDCRISTVTGSITLTYDTGSLSLDDLLALLERHGYPPVEVAGASPGQLDLVSSRLVERTAAHVGETLARATLTFVVEKALERSALALIGALA